LVKFGILPRTPGRLLDTEVKLFRPVACQCPNATTNYILLDSEKGPAGPSNTFAFITILLFAFLLPLYNPNIHEPENLSRSEHYEVASVE
jgi:hypothetical protein